DAALILAIQDQAVPLNGLRAKWINGADPKCRLCKAKDEWPQHILGPCPNMLEDAKQRHDKVVRMIFDELLEKFGAPQDVSRFANDAVELTLDSFIPTVNRVSYNKPDILCFDKVAKSLLVIEIAVTSDFLIEDIEKKKVLKYGPLASDLQLSHKVKVTRIPVVFGNVGSTEKARVNLS
ncbi:hypothetical protein MXB_3234, partial [Myxobolus squamalis]